MYCRPVSGQSASIGLLMVEGWLGWGRVGSQLATQLAGQFLDTLLTGLNLNHITMTSGQRWQKPALI
jgi:hypothetical protein